LPIVFARAARASFTSANLNISGYMLGGQIGCDYQFASNWIVGIEGTATGGRIVCGKVRRIAVNITSCRSCCSGHDARAASGSGHNPQACVAGSR
jgi:hypothetical protein